MKDILEGLNPEQKIAVTHKNGPLLIIAGAGTGKTTVITKRIAWLINEFKLNPEQILALTFTDKAAKEMEERVDILLPYGYFNMWISTFHAFCDRILREHGLDIGISNDFKLLDETDQWIFVRRNFEQFDLDYYKPLGSPTKFIHALLQHFSRAKDEGIYPEDYLEYAKNISLSEGSSEVNILSQEKKRICEIAEAYHTYQQLLLDNNYLDFGDLINYTRKLFQQRPAILNYYQDLFKYILIDEFQDTNWAQYDLIKLLTQKHQNITVVGDDDQSIYKFRGASISNILEFKKDYPHCKQIVLVQNYRSRQNILDLAYRFIQNNNPNRLEYQINKSKELSKNVLGKGLNLRDFKAINKKLISIYQDLGEIDFLYGSDIKEEVRLVLKKILDLKEQDPNLNWGDFVILLRANSYALPFLNACEAADIPYHFYASSELYSEDIVINIISYLKLLLNSYDNVSFYKILNSPILAINPNDLVLLLHTASKKTLSIYEVIKQADLINLTEDSRKKLDKLISMLEKHRDLAKEKSILQIIWSFLEDFDYLNYLKQNSEAELQRNVYILQQLFKSIEHFNEIMGIHDKSVRSFINYFNMLMEAGDLGSINFEEESSPDTLKLMTIHAAKGLEFEYVFVVNMVERRFPSTNRSLPISLPEDLVKEVLPVGEFHIQEERRLFYVAVTRAKKGVYFSAAENYGGVRSTRISRFLLESSIVKNNCSEDLFPIDLKSNVFLSKFDVYKNKDKILKEAIVNLPKQFSFSQLKSYQTCPLQYYYQFVLKIPVKGRAAMSFGKTLHFVLEKFFKEILEHNQHNQGVLFNNGEQKNNTDNKLSLERLLEIYEEVWIDEWYESKKQKQKYFKKGREILKKLYNYYQQTSWPNIYAIEKKFKIKIGDHNIKGTIDRIDLLPDETLEIIDYKTGNKPKNMYQVKDQLILYKLALEQILDIPVSKLTYYYLEEDDRVTVDVKKKDLEKMQDKIDRLISSIRDRHFSANANPLWCRRCDYRDICQSKKL